MRRATLEYGKYSSRYDAFLNGEILNAFNPSLGQCGCDGYWGVRSVRAGTSVRKAGRDQRTQCKTVQRNGGDRYHSCPLSGYDHVRFFSCQDYGNTIGGKGQIQGKRKEIFLVDMISEPSRITLKLRNQKVAGIQIDEGSESPL